MAFGPHASDYHLLHHSFYLLQGVWDSILAKTLRYSIHEGRRSGPEEGFIPPVGTPVALGGLLYLVTYATFVLVGSEPYSRHLAP
jgi:hypothetical protein